MLKLQNSMHRQHFFISFLILFNFQLRTTRMVQEFESSAFKAHDNEDYRKVWEYVVILYSQGRNVL